VQSALACVPADDRDLWVRMGMALHAEFPGDDGLALFDQWSQGGAGYKESDVRSTWRSFKPGKVKLGTLIEEAKRHGWKPDVATTAPATTPEQITQQRRAREEAARKAESEAASRHEKAASAAVQALAHASATGNSPYLTNKGVAAYGLRFEADGTVVVPMQDAAGKVWNIQRIKPDGTKRFLKDGRKSGLWHWIGSPDNAAVLLIAEGYATAASLHTATDYPCAVAFDCGNLAPVAKAIRERFPTARIVIAGDNDTASAARTGKNPGAEKARAAAKAVRGVCALPAGLPADKSDFNDLAQHAGPASVCAAIEAALAPSTAAPVTAHAKQTNKAPADSRFWVDDTGVYCLEDGKDGLEGRRLRICQRLDVEARTRDGEGNSWGYLLTFLDPGGASRQWAMPARMLSGDGTEYRSMLASMGFDIPQIAKLRQLLTLYIQTKPTDTFARCVERIGWHGSDSGGAFVLPHVVYGNSSERYVYQPEQSAGENTFRTRGDLLQWRERIGALCAGNSWLVFAVSSAFAGPLLRLANMDSGGFHLRGESSSGKTTALRLAASVYGGVNYMQRWRTTDNALEAIAAQHCDVLLILDELAQVDPKTAGECAYMLANEQSKARSTRTGQARARLNWRLLFLSAGEIGLAAHMAEGQKTARTGQEIRMADIPADAGAGMGIFETLHGFDTPAALAMHLVKETGLVYGTAGPAFIEHIARQLTSIRADLKPRLASIKTQFIPEGASGQVYRVGDRFALVALAGEMATEAGITGWQQGEATKAARTCMNAWIELRGGIGAGEETTALRQVKRFIESHGESRFKLKHRVGDDHAPNTMYRAGWRMLVNAEGEAVESGSDMGRAAGDELAPHNSEGWQTAYLVLPEVFKTEVCQGLDYKLVCKVLQERRYLQTDKNRLTKRIRITGTAEPVSVFYIKDGILSEDV
jgi:putative DNA primase/helicase